MTAHDLTLYTVAPSDSIRTAMEKIERNRHRAVVVVDEGRVVGTVSDGDIRRAFLHDVLPIAPVSRIMQLNPEVTTETDPARHAELVRRTRKTVIPIVTGDNRLRDVVLWFEPFDESSGA
jgi:CBS domain-containing protein